MPLFFKCCILEYTACVLNLKIQLAMLLGLGREKDTEKKED